MPRELVGRHRVHTRDMLQTILERCGAVVETATSAKEVIAKLDSFAPELLLSDIGMPEVDGYALIRHGPSSPPSWSRCSRRWRLPTTAREAR